MFDDLEKTQMIHVQDDEDDYLEEEEVFQPKKVVKKRRKLSKFGVFLIRLLLVIALGVAGYSGWKIYSGLKAYKEGNDTYEKLVEYTKAGDTSGMGVDDGVDFTSLKAINEDVVGWIRLDGTIINYPVVQGYDNDYYLNHLYNRNVNWMGSVFFDYRNNNEFKDRNTAIYAHHTNNGSMFYTLESYKSQQFYDEHPSFTFFHVNGKRYEFQAFCGLVLNADEPFMQLQFEDDEEFMNYINEFAPHSTFSSNVTMTKDDHMVTLVTCTDDFTNARYALFCKLVEVK